jgi:hypothetical protein
MNARDRWRIKLEAWADRLAAHRTEVLLALLCLAVLIVLTIASRVSKP